MVRSRPPRTTLAGSAAWCGCLALVLTTSVGCAMYRFGQPSLYRPDIRTVHVPIVESDSFRRNLGERVTEALTREIELKTPYKVVGPDRADSVLRARLITESKRVINETGTDDARDIETDFFVQISWVDRRGDLIMNHCDVPVSPILINVSQTSNFVPEAGQSLATAHQEAIRKLAEQIVGQMEIPW